MSGKWLALLIAAVIGVMVWQHKPAMSSNDPRLATGTSGIVLLSAQWCSYCKALRASFTAHGVPFTEIDVENTTEGYRAYESLSGRVVPITVVGQDVVQGYDVQRIDALLKPLGFEIQSAAPHG